jgi:hydroxyacylglutathione hydrolase
MREPISIEAIPILETNYVWALHDGRHAVLVDPGRAGPPLKWLEARSLHLTGLLITHHHWDHTDGIDEILNAHPVPVYGPADDRIPQVDHPLGEGDVLELETPALALSVLSVPGHTSIHLAYVGEDFVLCGDALFSAGCGRLFEGDAEQMQQSMDKLAALPGTTRVCCAHEYTLDNCRFALQVEPDNAALNQRLEQAKKLRRGNRITLPSTIADELSFNPFLRTRQPGVIAAAQQRSPDCGSQPHEVFGVIRRWKDQS